MASQATLEGDIINATPQGAAVQHRTRRSFALLSRGLDASLRFAERFLAESGFDRGPWLAVAFGAGVALWFGLDNRWQWLALIAACLATTLTGSTVRREGDYSHVRQALVIVPLVLALGCATVWTKSTLVGRPAIDRPGVSWLTATVLDREEQPANARSRVILATRDPDTGQAIRVRLNIPDEFDRPGVDKRTRVRVRARLMPPAAPMLPGAYDFARAAWFAGLSATGSAIAPVQIIRPAPRDGLTADVQLRLARHVREQLPGSSGAIAATLASGDRGGIAEDDIAAMRDSGLAHLLSISGLHVSAVIATAYFLALRLLALWPWLTLRVRLPVVAAGVGASAGIAYTLLTGAEVPTVRSCIGALLVLAALALGREALSLRMLAVAAIVVLLLWPEAIVGPSFQMSFAAVAALIAVGSSGRARAFLARREEAWVLRQLRNLTMLFLTGVVIEIALMPMGLYHFHRAGVYGALANVIAIPLTTIVIMPLIAAALTLDLAGAGAPMWWLAGKAIDAMLAMAHWFAARPGAVTHMPAMGTAGFILFVVGGLWIALWRKSVRWLGLIPASLGAAHLATVEPPDILVSGDGRHVGIMGAESGGKLLILRASRSDYARENLAELAGADGPAVTIEDWPGARCSRDFCAVTLERRDRADGNATKRTWHILIARGRDRVPARALAAACDRADIVIAGRWLPGSCHPSWLKADRHMLSGTGGLAIDLDRKTVATVADGQGDHGWWRREESRNRVREPRHRTAPDAGTYTRPAAASAAMTGFKGSAAAGPYDRSE